MADRYELKTAKQSRDGKTYWTKIGSMFPMKERDGFNLIFDALPTPTMDDNGQLAVKVTAFEPYKDDGQQARTAAHSQAKANGYQQDPLDDDIPF